MTQNTHTSSTSPQTSLQKDKIRILLLEGIHPGAAEQFAAAGYHNLERLSHAPPADELAEHLRNTHIVGIRSRTQLSAEIIESAPRLMAIGCFCIGTNQVDLRVAEKRGIPVFNAPYSNTRSVAELVLAEAILLLRGIPAKHMALKRGEWAKSARNSFELRGKTLGIIGYGNIGSQLGVMAEALGMQVVFHDVVKKLNLGNSRQLNSLEEVMQQADVVTLHVPADPSTAWMIGPEQIALMRPTSALINASRGNVVDLDALADALKREAIAGAAIDVYPAEPASNSEPFESPLRQLDNVILSPHIGGSTQEAQANIGLEVSEKLIRYSDNGSTLSAVNFPQVSLPPHAGSHRLLHIHNNVPGVMTEINRIFSETGINIAAQYLQTDADIGYVVMDIDSTQSATALARLRTIDATIRTRVLF